MTNGGLTSASANGSLPLYAECRYSYVDAASGCRSDRNCAACLRKAGCRIGTNGYCEPDADSQDSLDYQQAVAANLSLPAARDTNAQALTAKQTWEFPASEVKYCASDDATCSQCTSKNYWVTLDFPADSRFCVGAGGCVCVFNCASSFEEVLECPTSSSSGSGAVGAAVVTAVPVAPVPDTDRSGEDDQKVGAVVWITLAIVVALVVVAALYVYRCLRSRRSEAPIVARQLEESATSKPTTKASRLYVEVP